MCAACHHTLVLTLFEVVWSGTKGLLAGRVKKKDRRNGNQSCELKAHSPAHHPLACVVSLARDRAPEVRDAQADREHN